MSSQSLDDALRSAENPADMFRGLGLGKFTNLPDQYTHWIEEQRSWRESCAFADQSYHMSDLKVEGPDALELYSDFGVNSFEGFEVGQAKQLVVANPDGYFIGDAILFHLEENEFLSVGAVAAHNWLLYNAETGDYDLSVEMQPRPAATGDDPNNYRFQVQGPNAIDVMKAATEESLPELSFFNFGDVTINGCDVKLLRHGMAGEPGFEFWGPYEQRDEVRDAVLEAGDEYGIRRLGQKSYQSANVVLGWVPLPVPAIFDSDELKEYREWLGAREGYISIGGSFDSDDISDYYVTPVELGYDHIINFDHDFVGKEALQEEIENPERTKVTLVWDAEDVVDVYGSLFEAGETNKYMDLPVPRSGACHYDEVVKDGERVGVSKWMSYIYNEREMLSLAIVDVEHSEPGTEVTLVWGEADPEGNRVTERHVPKEITATVAPAPYKEDKR